MVSPIGENQVVNQLRGVACKLTSDHELQKDLMQEMFVHLIRVQSQQPQQTQSWYIKSCEFHVRNHLKIGRSIDSPKRARNGVPLYQTADDHDLQPNESVHPVDPFDLQGELSTNDILTQLRPRLTKMQLEILFLLMKGLGVREAGRVLGITHPAVIKHRKKIALIAREIIEEKEPQGVAHLPEPARQ